MTFLQSPEWENFQRSVGRETRRIEGQLIIQHKLPFGFNYLYSPRPHINNADSFLSKTELIAKEEKAIFLKIDPDEEFKGLKFKSLKVSRPIQPQKTIILDLAKSEEELLSTMHEKTRYNLRLAERREVEIACSGDFEKFWELLLETARRDRFRTHEKRYYEKLLAVKSENFSNELFFAEYQGKIIAAALINFYETGSHRIATYLYGASSREHKEVMAPHLLHWHIIRRAKKLGFLFYDLWGIDEKHWPGLTRFKKGFGGKVVEYPAAVDIIYRPIEYFFYRFVRKIF